MSTTDRIIIFVSVLGVVVLLGGASLLMPRINATRAQLQLTATPQVMENLPPTLAFTQAALGSFRGLAVDVLWARAIKMKEQGKYYEAMQLADWITKLQPRFPKVWEFHAWNMAYNISVTTQTPQERWMWVKAGIDLLRDEGIPLNPESGLLYKELSWIFLHKIGQFTDEMNWYYKRQVASKWHGILGTPPEGTTEQVIAWFRPVAEAYEKYVNSEHLSREVREELDRLIATDGELSEELEDLRPLVLARFDVRLRGLYEELLGSDPELAARLEPLRALVERQQQESDRPPLERLLDANPQVAPLLETVEEWGLELDEHLLQQIAMAQATRYSGDLRVLGLKETDDRARMGDRLRSWMDDESIAEERETLLAFVRAKVLHQKYHMDPMWMLELMEGDWFVSEEDEDELRATGRSASIPLDWRHPAAHGLYWASMGVRTSHGLFQPEDIIVLNTDRRVLHALQEMTRNGELIFDPISGYYRQMGDPRYIDAYHYGVFGATDRIDSERFQRSAAPESFMGGHENFLIQAVQSFYFYGDIDKAEQYYNMLRERYAAKQIREGRPERYARPLEEFVMFEFANAQSIRTLDDARTAISGLIFQAINDGLVNGRAEVAQRFLNRAKQLHRIYESKQSELTPVDVERGRTEIGDFDLLLADTFTRYLLIPPGMAVDPIMKTRVWRNAPMDLRRRVFDRVQEPLYAMARQLGLDPQVAFPPPPGMEVDRQSPPTGADSQPAPNPGDLLLSRPERK